MTIFFLRTLLYFGFFCAIWFLAAAWLSLPVSAAAGFLMKFLFPDWVTGMERSGVQLTLLTDLRLVIPGNGQLVLLAPEANYLHYAYGSPFFLALLCAGRTRQFIRNAFLGLLFLAPIETFGICLAWLKQALFHGGDLAVARLAFNNWQAECIALAYQISTLLLPSLAPILIWLLLEKHFAAALFVEGWLSGASSGSRDKKTP